MTKREPLFDLWILLTTLILVMIGLIMVFSTSSVFAQERFGDSYYFIKRQIIFASIGLGILVILMNIDYHSLRKPVYLILGAGILLLIGLSCNTCFPACGMESGTAASECSQLERYRFRWLVWHDSFHGAIVDLHIPVTLSLYGKVVCRTGFGEG